MPKSLFRTFASCLGLLSGLAATTSSNADDFYRSKQVTIVVGFSAGGGYDLTARLYARHFGRHIPGYPSVVVANMPGAGSAVAAATLANTPPQDGTRLGIHRRGRGARSAARRRAGALRRAPVPLDRRAQQRAERLRDLA